VALEKDGEDQFDQACEKFTSIIYSQGEEEYPKKIKIRKANWIGHFLLRTCRLKHVTERKVMGRIEVTVRRGRKHKQLLDDLKEKKGC
jgi:hypothetical protein